MAWLTGWGFRKEITVQDTNIDGNLSSFPVYVPIDADADFHEAKADGYDVRFTASDGDTELTYERVVWSGGGGGAGTGQFHVDVTSLLASGGATIYCYYGNAGAGDTTGDPWDANYKAVWHMEGLTDSSGNSHTLTNNGADSGATGKIDDGYDFVLANNDNMTAAHSNDFDPAAGFTVETWVNPDTNSPGTNMNFVQHFDTTTDDGYRLLLNTGTLWAFGVEVADTFFSCVSDVAATASVLQHIAGVRQADGTCILYRDGVAQADTESNAGAIDSTAAFYIGSNALGAEFFDGIIDEVRYSNVERTANWLKFQHANVNEGDNELTWGAEVPVPAGHPTMRRFLNVPFCPGYRGSV